MKTIVPTLIFLTINLYADSNWIPIEPINKTKTVKSDSKIAIDLSQIAPVNKIMKNAMLVKQLIDATNKKEKVTTNNKNWFMLNTKHSK